MTERRPRTQAQQDVRDDAAPPWAVELINQVGEISKHQALMKQTLGEQSEDGKGGKGLVGDVAAMKLKMDGLMSLKAQGIGLIAGVVLVLAIVLFGFKGLLGAVLGDVGGKL